MEVDEHTLKVIDLCKESITALEAHAAPLYDLDVKTLRSLPPVDRAQLSIALAFTLTQCWHMALRLRGTDIDTEFHPIKQELERVRSCLRRFQTAVPSAQQQPQDQNDKRTLRLDMAATDRLLGHLLSIDKLKRKPKNQQQKRATEVEADDEEGETAEQAAPTKTGAADAAAFLAGLLGAAPKKKKRKKVATTAAPAAEEAETSE
eukprot:TRINITY_DN1793_c0_g1_i2.p1 TRINITY_DN1793_c0_g1~~TRINITY_DN1793_c0_g1_i2.p1  ORF type:complete len:205 (+),score=46.94 TRINITY_DN1793_c0_g1_i2:34-648(+)